MNLKVDCNKIGVRESYLRFPLWSQPAWTWLSGKPLSGEQPLLRPHPLLMMICTLSLLMVAVLIHLLLLEKGVSVSWAGFWLTPIFAMIVTGALRKIQVVYIHYCAHGTFIRNRQKLNQFIGNVLVTITFVQDLAEYKQEHFEHHKRTIFTTLRDADAALLYRFGLRPGRTIRQLYLVLAWVLVSPVYHVYFLAARLRSNLLARRFFWRLVSVLWLVILIWVLPSQFGISNVALAIWLPMVWGYQASALLQFLTEHVWLVSEEGPTKDESYSQRCIGRFCGEPLPENGTFVSWIAWWLRTLLLHIPLRLSVLVGDLPAHDWHHLCGLVGHRPAQWPLAIFARQQAIDAGNDQGMGQRECWGLSQMLNHVFTSMAAAPALNNQGSVPSSVPSVSSDSPN